jgi:hypothetical protein
MIVHLLQLLVKLKLTIMPQHDKDYFKALTGDLTVDQLQQAIEQSPIESRFKQTFLVWMEDYANDQDPQTLDLIKEHFAGWLSSQPEVTYLPTP